jgi:putative cofactor-binding repeat protein
MRFLSFACLVIAFLICSSAHAKRRRWETDTVSNARQLDSIFATRSDTINIYLKPGDYYLKGHEDVDTAVDFRNGLPVQTHFTYGIKIKAKAAYIKGSPNYGSTIYTNAGYGIYFESTPTATIENLIITGGIRDTDSLATDAAIVVRNSKVQIVSNIIFENLGDSATIRKTKQGVMGICGRERSYLFIFNNQIARNSWNGIGIYKDARATITGNLIDGVDVYNSANLRVARYMFDKEDENTVYGGGRGIGILLTRNAQASIETNVIKRYWRGIGIFVNANADIRENLIEDIKTWGILVWDADTGKPVARIDKNVIYKTGACGVSIIRYRNGGDPGYFRNNILAETAQDRRYDAPSKYCYQCALAVHGRPDGFDIDKNLFYKNFWLSPCDNDQDLVVGQFVMQLQQRFSTLPLQWYAGYSEFIQRFYLYTGKK